MRAVLVTAFQRLPTLSTLPDPAPSPAGAVIRVEATGLCRSDWHGWMGHDPDITLPHVPGHEFAGVVEAVGDDVRRYRPGDRVTVPFVCACGACASCAHGDHQVCEHQTQPGFTHWGSFAEYVRVDHADVNLVAVPDDLSATTAASLGCRFATAFRAVAERAKVRPGEWVAVHGCGGVGLSAVMIAAAAGARVVAVDVSQRALDLAREFGAEVQLDSRDSAAAIRDATGGGAHVSIDALGSPDTCAASVLSLRRRGRHVQVGLLPPNTAVPMERVIAYEIDVLGSHGMAAHAYPEMMGLVARGRLRPDLLVTDTIPLGEAPEALAGMETRTGPGVTVIDPRR